MINKLLNNQMYALCILAALSLRQHVQQNWQLNQAKRIPPPPSFNFLKCIDPNNSPRTENIRKDYTNFMESTYAEVDESKCPDFLYSCYRKLSEGAQTIVEGIGVSISNSKLVNNHWTQNILESIEVLSDLSTQELWA